MRGGGSEDQSHVYALVLIMIICDRIDGTKAERIRTKIETHKPGVITFAIGMKHQDIRNYNNRLQPDDVKRLNSVKYPIHDLLRWLENVEVNDKVKYRFLKYIYNEKDRPSSRKNGSSDASQHERWRDRPNEVQLDYDNDKKRIPTESSSESGLDDMLSANRTQFKNPERRVKPHRRKYNNKTTSKKATKQAPKRKKTGVKGCEQIVWEPLLFDNDDSDENDERSAGRQY